MQNAYENLSVDHQDEQYVPRTILVLSRHAGDDIPDQSLEVGPFDAVVIESFSRAYSQIRRFRPDLIVMFVSMDDSEGFQALSLLQLDPEVARIPVLLGEAVKGTELDDDEEESVQSGFLAGCNSRPCWN